MEKDGKKLDVIVVGMGEQGKTVTQRHIQDLSKNEVHVITNKMDSPYEEELSNVFNNPATPFKNYYADLHPESKKMREAVVIPVRSTPKIGRNEKCPCGSKKKYKNCCG